tara:strand:+ start:2038 stop:3159 length:1122 start_codon:yes stop_codon:yes gene_type:complete
MHKRFLPLVGGIEQLTDEWFKQRRGRLTGSKLGSFCFIKDKEEYDNYFAEVFEGKPKPPFTEQQLGYMQYGREHEDVAICAFLDAAPKQLGDIYIAESPFYKHSDPSVGASPDGTYAIFKGKKIVEEGVIEIKCPGKKPNRPYTKWKHYYVPQTFWEMSCSGHKKAITISWGPRNMRAWRYDWDEDYWKVLCNIVDGFRRHVPYEEFQDLQAQLIEASHRIADNAECLHPESGWKQKASKVKEIKERIFDLQKPSRQPKKPKKEPKKEPKKPKKEPKQPKKTKKRKSPSPAPTKRRRLSSFEGDLMYAEVLFAQDTDWYKNDLPLLVPNEQDRKREFVVMSCGKQYTLIPGYAPKGKVFLTGDEPIIHSVKIA